MSLNNMKTVDPSRRDVRYDQNIGTISGQGVNQVGIYPPQGDGLTTESGYEDGPDGESIFWIAVADETGQIIWEQERTVAPNGAITVATKNYRMISRFL